jgi:hypothetical protein
MYNLKIIYGCLLLFSFTILIGCAATFAPDDWLPETDEVPENVYGGWITLITEPDSLNTEEHWMQYSGEFISLDDENIYLLFDSVYQVPKRKIRNSILELDGKNTTGYGLWVFVGTIATISNGYYLMITAPLWLFFGIPAVVGESSRDKYETEEPSEEYWESIRKFARFPQGVDDIELNDIKPITEESF